MWKSVCFLAVCFQVFIWGALPTYIVGGQDNKATLWITDTSGSEPRTILLGENNEKYSEAFSLTAVGSKLFCVGRQQDELNANATLWIVDTKDLQPRAVTLVKPTGLFSAAYSITAIGNQLCCVGQAQNQENYVEKATLWITDILGSAPIAVNLGEITDPNSKAHSITAIGNKLYCAGEQKFSGSPFYRAILWITDLAGSSLNSITLADDGASSIASSITSAFQQI